MTTDIQGLDDAQLYAQLRSALLISAADLHDSPVILARGLDPTYRVRPHNRAIGNALLRVQTGEVKRLMIFMPPQTGKSTTVGVWGPFWWLIHHPDHRVIVASYAASLAVKRGAAVRDLVQAEGHQYELQLSRANRSRDDWSLTTGGGMRSIGVGGALTGFPADLAIIDDPHKDRREANSRVMRDHVWDWYLSVLLSRMAPDGVIILILTRWHEDDLAARLLAHDGRREQGGQWEVLHLPAFADHTLTGGADVLGRAHGAPLPHPKIPTSDTGRLRAFWEQRRRDSGPQEFGALYQGDPKPVEGALVSRKLLTSLRDYTGGVSPQRIAVAVDPSGGGRDVAGIVAGHLGEDGRLWMTHDRSDVMSSNQWSRTACELAAEIDAALVVVETNFGGDMALLAIRTAWDLLRREHAEQHPGEPNPYADRLPPRVVAVRAKQGKLLRADPIAQQMAQDRIRFGQYLPLVEEEWATWQPDDPESPGRIDASAYLAYALLRVPGAGERIATAHETRRDQTAQGGWTARRIERRQ